MSSYLRRVKTASGTTAVQVVAKEHGVRRIAEYLGSAHDEAELAALMRLGRQRLLAGQQVLDCYDYSAGYDPRCCWSDPSDTAVVAWLGYDAPQNDVSVASTEKAEAGAPRLNNFLTGIKSWRWEGGGDLHQTVVSHSYGSTTAGLAMKDIGAGVVDDFIYTGSPGAGTSTIGSLGVDPSHVWVSAFEHLNWVKGIPPDQWESFRRDPVDLEGIQHLSGDASGASSYHANCFGWIFANHSTYFDAPAPGQYNEELGDTF